MRKIYDENLCSEYQRQVAFQRPKIEIDLFAGDEVEDVVFEWMSWEMNEKDLLLEKYFRVEHD